MSLEFRDALESAKEGTKEVTETVHEKTSSFHENYVSKVLPDCGKYGDAARFTAELVPGVAEYNAIVEGDWTKFAIAAGIDAASVAAGAFTAGTAYGPVKAGAAAAKTGAKAAVGTAAKAGTKKAVKEVAEAAAKKGAKEAAETGAKKAVKEVAETGAKNAVKEVAETGAEKAAKETLEAGTKKAVRETVESGAEKAAKETIEESANKTAKELAEGTIERADNEIEKLSQIVKNKLEGTAREGKKLEELSAKYGKENVIREAYIRDGKGNILKDPLTNEARRIDFVVRDGNRISHSIEVTSETAKKEAQIAKERRILDRAKEIGGAFIKDSNTGELIKFPERLVTTIERME